MNADMEMQYNRETLAYRERIALAKLEESKASERVRVTEYDQARFDLEFFLMTCKAAEKAGAAATPQQPPDSIQPK